MLSNHPLPPLSPSDPLQLEYAPLAATGSDPAPFLHTLSLTNLRLRMERFGGRAAGGGGPMLLPLAVPTSYYAISEISVTGACICNEELVPPEVSSFILLSWNEVCYSS